MKFRRSGILTILVILVMAAWAVVGLIRLKGKVAEAEAYKAQLGEQIALAEQENAGLTYAIRHSEDDATIEDVAREKLGLVKPGEKIFYDVGN